MEAIFKELEKYIPRHYVVLLELDMQQPGTMPIVLTVSDIIKSFNSTEDDEIKVSKILSTLLAVHFGSVRVVELTKDNIPFLEVIAISSTNKALFGYISPLGTDQNKFICRNYNETLIMVTHFIELPIKKP